MTADRVRATSAPAARLPAAALAVRAAVGVPLALYAFALMTGAVAAALVVFPTNEGSAYYVDVARNFAAGRGLVIDSIWSYATPPLILPRPAFELWQPMASFIAAIPMALLGGSFKAAQLGGVVVGAAIAPLAWAITTDAAPALGTPTTRVRHLAIGAGMVAAVLAPVLLAVAVPDSTLPFLVFGTLACWLAPRALRGGNWAQLALGAALGLAYLSRHEAMYIGAVVVIAAAFSRESWAQLARRLALVAVGGLVVVSPWLIRNLAVFGTPLPGQAVDNALLTHNEQIFAYAARPTLAEFLAQGPGAILGHIVTGTIHNIVDVLLLPAAPISAIGLIGVTWFVRRGQLRGTALAYLLAAGTLTLAVDSLIFPVASMWGTFLHSSGPLLIGLTVAAVLVSDRLVDAVRRRRNWNRANAWLAPLALGLMAAPMAMFQLLTLGGGTATEARYDALAALVRDQPVVISDHPVWLHETSGVPTLALPDEPPSAILALARQFGASMMVVVERQQAFGESFENGPLGSCFERQQVPPGPAAGSLVFAIAESCVHP